MPRIVLFSLSAADRSAQAVEMLHLVAVNDVNKIRIETSGL